MNTNQGFISEKQWEDLLLTLSPTKIAALEKTLKTYHSKYRNEDIVNNVSPNKENDEFEGSEVGVKTEPVTSTRPFLGSHKTKNRGLTYENGRRNLKSETVTVEERERRAKRRERNRVAAQKCRERRQLQIDELQHQVELLRSTEKRLYSTLKELSNEENELRVKLSSHNCVISENSNGDISFMIQSNNIKPQFSQNSYSLSRPRSLSVSHQGYANHSSNPQTSLDQFLCKDDSLSPLLSPDSFDLIRCHLKTESTPTTPTIKTETVSRQNEDGPKVAFSWSNSIVDQLSMQYEDQGANNNYLSTPVVDAPFYSTECYVQRDSNLPPVNWRLSNVTRP